MSIADLPHLNASLNLVATILLLTGIVLIKRKKETAHKWTMISCFAVSCVFLVSYVTHKLNFANTPFPRETYPTAAIFYYIILITHVILAALVPFLAITTIVLGLRDKRTTHKKFAKITFPVWLYVSITGVLVYLMIYWWFPAVEVAT